jgi:hypothetical protein
VGREEPCRHGAEGERRREPSRGLAALELDLYLGGVALLDDLGEESCAELGELGLLRRNLLGGEEQASPAELQFELSRDRVAQNVTRTAS